MKIYTIKCVHLNGRECKHPDQPHGIHPSGGVCAKACKHYDGPAAIMEDKPVVEKPLITRDEINGCTPCAAAARQRAEKRKHDPAEAARILDEAMKTDLSDDQTKVD